MLLSQAEDIDIGASDLASCIGNERILIEECGNLLSQTHEMQVSLHLLTSYLLTRNQEQKFDWLSLQVKECSLRAQLIQAKRSSQ